MHLLRLNLFTEALRSNDMQIYTYIQTHRLMGQVYEVCRLDGQKCHNIHINFRKYWFRLSKVDMGGTQTHRQHVDCISLLLVYQNKESSLQVHVLRTFLSVRYYFGSDTSQRPVVHMYCFEQLSEKEYISRSFAFLCFLAIIRTFRLT
jgi:hypothetical protein